MPLGTIKLFDDRRDFGFIVPHEAGPDVFFHVSQVAGGLIEKGARVRYVLGVNARTNQAEARDVRRLARTMVGAER